MASVSPSIVASMVPAVDGDLVLLPVGETVTIGIRVEDPTASVWTGLGLSYYGYDGGLLGFVDGAFVDYGLVPTIQYLVHLHAGSDGYIEDDIEQAIDVSYGGYTFLPFSPALAGLFNQWDRDEQTDFSQELRGAFTGIEGWRFMLGGYYYKGTNDEIFSRGVGGPGRAAAAQTGALLPDFHLIHAQGQNRFNHHVQPGQLQ